MAAEALVVDVLSVGDARSAVVCNCVRVALAVFADCTDAVSSVRLVCRILRKDWASVPALWALRSTALLATALLTPKDCNREVAWDTSSMF